ncbi:unnamed protein product, partial [Mycena citricolor]
VGLRRVPQHDAAETGVLLPHSQRDGPQCRRRHVAVVGGARRGWCADEDLDVGVGRDRLRPGVPAPEVPLLSARSGSSSGCTGMRWTDDLRWDRQLTRCINMYPRLTDAPAQIQHQRTRHSRHRRCTHRDTGTAAPRSRSSACSHPGPGPGSGSRTRQIPSDRHPRCRGRRCIGVRLGAGRGGPLTRRGLRSRMDACCCCRRETGPRSCSQMRCPGHPS